jgi:NADH/NAD ratio-sensing transcriptional regulator Rex
MTKIGNLPDTLQKKLLPRSVERLSKYRRLLSRLDGSHGKSIFSHELARLLNLIKEILNFTSVPLDVPDGVYLKDYDIITSLEEIGFFIMN